MEEDYFTEAVAPEYIEAGYITVPRELIPPAIPIREMPEVPEGALPIAAQIKDFLSKNWIWLLGLGVIGTTFVIASGREKK